MHDKVSAMNQSSAVHVCGTSDTVAVAAERFCDKQDSLWYSAYRIFATIYSMF